MLSLSFSERILCAPIFTPTMVSGILMAAQNSGPFIEKGHRCLYIVWITNVFIITLIMINFMVIIYYHHHHPQGHQHHHDDHLDGQAGHLQTNQGQCSPLSSSCKEQLVQGFGKPATGNSVRGPCGLSWLESPSNTGLTSMSCTTLIAFAPTTSSFSYCHEFIDGSILSETTVFHSSSFGAKFWWCIWVCRTFQDCSCTTCR